MTVEHKPEMNRQDGTTQRGLTSSQAADFAGQVSLIIVSYWTGPLLMRAVMSALRQPRVGEVIVVDNGNWADEMDRLRELAGEHVDKLVILSGHGNIGYAAGCNKGVKAARGEYVFILNPDAIVPDNAVADLLDEARDLTGHWLLGAKLINPDGTEQAGGRRETLTPWTAFVEMTKLYRFAPKHPYFRRLNYHQDPCPGCRKKVPVISGACMLMRRETYLSIDGMDEEYFLHVEDVDFCLRLANAGGDIYYTPAVSILHFKSSSRASRVRIELRKARSLVRYFWIHFRQPYPDIFLVAVSGLVWLGFGLRTVMIGVERVFSIFGLDRLGRTAPARPLAPNRHRVR